jgi:hypothetical protein
VLSASTSRLRIYHLTLLLLLPTLNQARNNAIIMEPPPGAATWGSSRPEKIVKIIVLGGKAVVGMWYVCIFVYGIYPLL